MSNARKIMAALEDEPSVSKRMYELSTVLISLAIAHNINKEGMFEVMSQQWDSIEPELKAIIKERHQ